jgi:hypothetical protein
MTTRQLPFLGLILAVLFGTRGVHSGAPAGPSSPAVSTVDSRRVSNEGKGPAHSPAITLAEGGNGCSATPATLEFDRLHWWLAREGSHGCSLTVSPVWEEICKINPNRPGRDELLPPSLNEIQFMALCLGKTQTIRAMMASVPNPRRTHLGLMTDRAIEAIQVAASEAGFLPVSHYLPWPSSSEAGSQGPESAVDSLDPGVLVFRGADEPEFLAVFLIPELPTEGLDRKVFASAQRVIARLSKDAVIQFDGPNFSGSVASLRVLGADPTIAQCIQAVSGSVTNAGVEYSDPKPGCVSTLRLTQTGDEEALREFVKGAEAFGYRCNQIAILSEEGTQYGQQVKMACPQQATEQGALWFLHFPREISKLRNAYGAETGKATSSDSSGQPDLGMPWQDSEATQRDDLPTYGGKQTPLSQETVLSTLAITLKAQGIKAIGVLATDPMDEAFLIRSIKKSSPDVRLFLRDPDLLYLRTPDVGTLNGTLLVTNYPLIPQNQFWSAPSGQRERLITFPSAFQEGVYNAFVQLIEDPTLPFAKNGLKRLEWRWPAGPLASPEITDPSKAKPLWLATMGTAGNYPIKLLNFDEAKVKRSELKLHALDLGPPQYLPTAFWIVISGLGLLHVVGLSFRRAAPSFFKHDFSLTDRTATVTMVRTFCHVMALLTVTLAQLILGSSYLFFYDSGWGYRPRAYAVAGVTAFLLAAACWQMRTLYVLYRQQEQLAVPDAQSKILSPRRVFWTGAAGMAILAGAGVFWEMRTLPARFDNAFLHFRNLNLSSGVSPALPLASVLMVMYFGVWAYLRRLSYWEHRYVAMFDLKLDEVIRQDFRADVKAIDTCLLGPLENLKWMLGFGLTLGMSIVAFRPWIVLEMIEPSRVSQFVSFFVILALLTLWLNWFRFIDIWVHLRDILEHLENLPLRTAFQRLPREKSAPILHWGSSQSIFLLPQVLDRLRALAVADASEENIALRNQFESRVTALMNQGVVETEVVEYRKVVGGAPRSTLRAFSRSQKDLVLGAREEMTHVINILSDRLLKEYWRRGSTGTKADTDARPGELKYLLAEDVVALPFYVYILKVMSELRNILFFLGIALSLLFAAFHTYSFRADQSIDWWFFGLFAFMGGGIVLVIAQMERNALLSRLSDGTPGELGTGFYLQLLKYGTVPFLTIFGSQVPSISNLVLKWVQPALEALH